MTKNQFWKGSTFFVFFSFDLTLLLSTITTGVHKQQLIIFFQECFVSGAVSIWGIPPLATHHQQLLQIKLGKDQFQQAATDQQLHHHLRVQQHGKRGGGGDWDNGQWQHQQQAAKHQPPDHLPHTSSYCGQTGRVEALIAWIYPFATYFERNVVIIPMPTSFTRAALEVGGSTCSTPLHLTRRPILDQAYLDWTTLDQTILYQTSLDWTTLDQTMRNRTLLDWTTQKCSSIQSIYISVKKTIIEFSFCKF